MICVFLLPPGNIKVFTFLISAYTNTVIVIFSNIVEINNSK